MTYDTQPPPTSKSQRAALARQVSGWVQVVFLVVLFVLWRVRGWPFWSAAELCVVAGMVVYSLLNVYAALMVAWTGPVMAARVSRLAGIVIYAVMRYVYHDPLWRAMMVWAGLWISSWYLVSRARRRALAGSPVSFSSVSR